MPEPNYAVSSPANSSAASLCIFEQTSYRPPQNIPTGLILVNGRGNNVVYTLVHALVRGNELTYDGNPLEELEEQFYRLVEEWREETRYSSSGTDITNHIAYCRIIAMGRQVVPLIIRELRRELDHWFWALLVLTEHDPVVPEDVGDLEKMREAWLQWADSQDFSEEFTIDQNNG